MKGYHVRKSKTNFSDKAILYRCNHPMFNDCSLFKMGEFGLAVVQQRYNNRLKVSWWGPVDGWLLNDIFSEGKFNEVLSSLVGVCDEDGLYPVIEVRRLMYKLGMKPLKKLYFELPVGSQEMYGL